MSEAAAAVEGTVKDFFARNSSEKQSVPRQRPHGSHQVALRSFDYPGKAIGPHYLVWHYQTHLDAAPNRRGPASTWRSLAASLASVRLDRYRSQPLSYSPRRWIGRSSMPLLTKNGRRHTHALNSQVSIQTLQRPEKAPSGSSAAVMW